MRGGLVAAGGCCDELGTVCGTACSSGLDGGELGGIEYEKSSGLIVLVVSTGGGWAGSG